MERARLLESYLALRLLLGWMGILLPFLLVLLNWIFGGRGIKTSISAYYHVDYVGAVFVGALFAIGMFLLAYKGYERQDKEKISDNSVGNFAGVFALGVAFFPTRPATPSDLDRIFGYVHFGCALLLFLAFAYFCFVIFVKTAPGKSKADLGKNKRRRNRWYHFCGVVISLCIVLLGLNLFAGNPWPSLKPVFWLEALAVVAFGISWLVKSKALEMQFAAIKARFRKSPAPGSG